jgi:hypothetical protein
MVTTVPTGPDVGLIEEITGAGAPDEAADAPPPMIMKNAAITAVIRNARSCSCILSFTSSAPLFERRLRLSGVETGDQLPPARSEPIWVTPMSGRDPIEFTVSNNCRGVETSRSCDVTPSRGVAKLRCLRGFT